MVLLTVLLFFHLTTSQARPNRGFRQMGGITYLAKENRVDLIPQLGLFLPIVIAPLAYIFFDNEFMIFRNGFYISNYLRGQVSEVTDETILMVEKIGFRYLGVFNRDVFRLLSFGRWILFVVPTLGPVIYSLAYLQNWTVTNKVIVEIDFIFAYVLVIAIISTLRLHAGWMRIDEHITTPCSEEGEKL